MITLEIIFWICLVLVFYTYIGYGIVLRAAVAVRESLRPRVEPRLPDPLPEVTLFITAWNEQSVVNDKMCNSLLLNYPKSHLHIVWVTDGSTDGTNDELLHYPDVRILYTPERRGKAAAMNRGMKFIQTPITIFTDANTMLNEDAVMEIVRQFSDPRVGCVAGEKRVLADTRDSASASGEGIYWRYESKLKEWDARLGSSIGAAGELFAIRTELYPEQRTDTLLDDFTIALQIAMRGYRIAYTPNGYAIEGGSEDILQEQKRKVRIAAGGLQAIHRLRPLLNPFRYGMLSLQYISHRVLRWSVTPVALVALVPLNVALVVLSPHDMVYWSILLLQALFYLAAILGYAQAKHKIRHKSLFVPYYFVFMNLNVFRAVVYLYRRKKSGNTSGTWERSRRASIKIPPQR